MSNEILELIELLKNKDTTAESITQDIKDSILNSEVINNSEQLSDLIFTVAQHVNNEEIFNELTDIFNAAFTHNPKLLFAIDKNNTQDTPLSCAVRHSNIHMTEYLLKQFADKKMYGEDTFQQFFAPESIKTINPDETSIYDLAKKVESKKRVRILKTNI